MRRTLKINSVVCKCLYGSNRKIGWYISVSAFSKDAGDCKLVFLVKIQKNPFPQGVLSGQQAVAAEPLPLCFCLLTVLPPSSVKLHHRWFGCLYFGA